MRKIIDSKIHWLEEKTSEIKLEVEFKNKLWVSAQVLYPQTHNQRNQENGYKVASENNSPPADVLVYSRTGETGGLARRTGKESEAGN